MRYYFAPMEGLTDGVYRRMHHKFFGGVDRYYMPFISPTIHRTLTPKESRELPPADSVPFTAIPQVMSKVAEDALWAIEQCAIRGYQEVNLNLGCPSGTVVAKGKGAGMLRDTDSLKRFLDGIFAAAPLPISIKTRLGLESSEEFPAILEVYDQYPIKELTIHPRTRKQFYNGELRLEMFQYAVEHSKNPLCFNGDLTSPEDIQRIADQYPQVKAVMLGRGLVRDPGMLTAQGTTIDALAAFHDALFEEYSVVFDNARNAMTRLKESWHYLELRFEENPKIFKRLRKATDVAEFRSIATEIFQTQKLL
ncbi:MAG: tRNA-dihydrouridine synthase family protein [Ruminococcaceae bacterium]|nr:tRNA-dihydrouridine synthase family protein [Oscillospiraceae bacterium]